MSGEQWARWMVILDELYYKISLTNIVKHAVEHDTWNIAHIWQHLQVQVTTWPHCRSMLESAWNLLLL